MGLGLKGAVSRTGNQRKVHQRKLDYGASGAPLLTLRTFCDAPIGHVTNFMGG